MPEPDLLQIFGRPVHDAGLQYVVSGSLGSHEGQSEKHVRDIRRMFEVSSAAIDEPLLESELARRGLMETYRQIRELR